MPMQSANCPDLQWLLRGIYRMSRDPAAGDNVDDPWMVTLPGRHGVIYPFGRERLAVEVEDPRIAKRVTDVLDGAEPYQRGEGFRSYTFPVSHLGAVADIILPRKVRHLSAAARKRLAAVRAGTLFRAQTTVLDSARERQDACKGAETTNMPSSAVGAIVART